MSNYINLIIIFSVFSLINGCTSAHNVVSSVGLNELVNYCDNTENSLSVKTMLISSPDEQERFFGRPVDGKISPILICYNNNTEKDYGLNADEIKIRFPEVFLVNGDSREIPKGDIGSYSSVVSFIGGTALLGIVPGIVFGVIASQGEASASAQVSIDMQNKKLQSGVLKSNSKTAGFLYIQDDKDYISENYIDSTIETNLLILPSKKTVVVKSELILHD